MKGFVTGHMEKLGWQSVHNKCYAESGAMRLLLTILD